MHPRLHSLLHIGHGLGKISVEIFVKDVFLFLWLFFRGLNLLRLIHLRWLWSLCLSLLWFSWCLSDENVWIGNQSYLWLCSFFHKIKSILSTHEVAQWLRESNLWLLIPFMCHLTNFNIWISNESHMRFGLFLLFLNHLRYHNWNFFRLLLCDHKDVWMGLEAHLRLVVLLNKVLEQDHTRTAWGKVIGWAHAETVKDLLLASSLSASSAPLVAPVMAMSIER